MKWLCTALAVVAVIVVVEGGRWKHPRQERTRPTRCMPPSPCFPSRQVIAEFAATLNGTVYQPHDDLYPTLVTNYNRRLTRHPAIVVVVESEQDVQKAVLFARKFYLLLTVTSSNDGFGRAMQEDAAMQINLSNLQSVRTNIDQASSVVDPGTLTAQPGATWAQVRAAAEAVSRDVVGAAGNGALPVGEVTQAGGVGVNSRFLGLVADNLVSARMVTMGGNMIEVSDQGATVSTLEGTSRFTTVDPGLWRALRGSGAGNLGIVTSYTYRMHLPPSYVTQVSASYVLYQDAQFVGREPLKYLLPLVYNLPDQWGGVVSLSGRTSATTVGQKGVVTFDLVHYGAYNSASYLAITDLLNYDGQGSRLSVSVTNRTWTGQIDDNLSYQFPGPGRMYGFNTLLPTKALTDTETLSDLVDNLLLILNDPAVNAHYFCVLRPLGGEISTMNSTALVNQALRKAAMSINCLLTWSDDDIVHDDVFVSYAMDYAKRIKSFGIGTSMAMGMFEDEEDWKHSLYGDNYRELVRVKTKYDVDNYFWCHSCVASDFRLDCRMGCDEYGRKFRQRLMNRSGDDDDSGSVESMEVDED